MLSAVTSLFVFVSSLGAARAISEGKQLKFTETVSAGHAVSVTTSDDFSKWAIFPAQKELHTRVVSKVASADVKDMDKSAFVNHENFWDHHRSLFGISPSTEMNLKEAKRKKQGSVSQMTYNQVVDGVKVFGGEFRMTTGAHGGVVNAHGLPFRSTSQRQYDSSQKETILTKSIDKALQDTLFQNVEAYVRLSEGMDVTVEGMGSDPVSGASRSAELVWYSPGMAKGKVQEGSWALTYFLQGVKASTTKTNTGDTNSNNKEIKINDRTQKKATTVGNGMPTTRVYDVFVDAHTLAVVDFMDKTFR